MYNRTSNINNVKLAMAKTHIAYKGIFAMLLSALFRDIVSKSVCGNDNVRMGVVSISDAMSRDYNIIKVPFSRNAKRHFSKIPLRLSPI